MSTLLGTALQALRSNTSSASRRHASAPRKRVRSCAVAAVVATVAVASGLTASLAAAGAADVGSSACSGTSDPQYKTVKAAGLRLRTGPGTNYPARGLLAKGDRLFEDCQRDRRWYYVHLLATSGNGLPKGTHGWVLRDYVRDTYLIP